ncbi:MULTISPECIES: Stk1 family PASTA domain-containing Ser/Thr kinase [Clostridium]|uniref:non-specific serine/threonine protein kinase n=1 Tax=Clostridium senegalense TaxID=1465809 RepID=A0A6M0GXS9_9CLOT|nr:MULTISPECIES: Stk1 family PASTA domain-containing Ser/Thr kinase [Clostridium]NEU03290.1 Stk1 family PASTA domain-containing Ser/Thr kinase [Clostridium senegalense]
MIGTILGSRYELIEKIGEGGMAIVYKAKCRLLNRYVAVKILKEQYTSNIEFMDKFRKEAAATASFSHNNIVNIFDVGVEGKYNYIVMELVEGKTLKQVICENGSLPCDQVVEFGIQIAQALECAHRNGVIHRDIKPHNILVKEDGVVKVTDFGIAKASNSDTITHTTKVIGSAHYFSPEQAKGKVVDFRTDIYSLGIVLYEMATGKLPFDGDSPVSIALKHIQEPVVPPTAIKYDIPLNISNLILKAIEKEPIKRYQSATEILHDLRQIRSNISYNIPQNNGDTEEFTRIMSPINIDEDKSSKTSYEDSNNYNLYGKNDDEEDYDDEDYDDEEYDDDEEDEVKPRKKRSKNKKMKLILVSIGIFIVLIGAFAITLSMKPSTDAGSSKKEVKIPQIVGKSEENAKTIIEELGLVFKVDGEEKSDKPKGEVLKCIPNEGTTVKKKSEVKVIVSSGPEEVTVPDLGNLTLQEAQNQIANMGFKVGKVIEENNETYSEGTVIRQDPQPGTAAKKGDTIDVVVSKGSAVKYSQTPDLINMTVDEASNVLSAANLKLGATTEVSTTDKSRDGKIFYQSVSSGSKVNEQTAVDVKYYKYKEPEPEKVSVPYFVGMTLGDAKNLANSLGLNVSGSGEDSDIIESQSIQAETKVNKGENISVTVKKQEPEKPEKPEKPDEGENQQ